MSETVATRRPPLGVRLAYGLRKEPDWQTMSADELAAVQQAHNRKMESGLIRLITGFPERGVRIDWQVVTLPDRQVRVRVYRPPGDRDSRLPLVVHVHGGGFVGTAAQCDWNNSRMAALPAVVVSVEHRLLSPGITLSAAVDDGWDVLRHLVEHAADWGVDPARVAVVGESTGGAIVALAAMRARQAGLALRAQVLVNPALDVTTSAFDYASMVEYRDSPTLTSSQLELFRRLAAPEGTDAAAVSPLRAEDLSGLATALVVVPELDPLADQGRAYVARLREAGTPVQLSEHSRAGHAFLSMPGLVSQAKAARDRIAAFLSEGFA